MTATETISPQSTMREVLDAFHLHLGMMQSFGMDLMVCCGKSDCNPVNFAPRAAFGIRQIPSLV